MNLCSTSIPLLLPVEKLGSVPGVKAHSLALTSRQKGFAHLKLYGFETAADERWLFTGSVNCTTAALLGPTVEAGLLRPVTAEELKGYFEEEELAETSSASHLHLETQLRGWLVLLATDFGDHFSLQLAPSHDSLRPLGDVELILKSGQKQDHGICPTNAMAEKMGKGIPGWTADRLDAFINLLADLAVLERVDDELLQPGTMADEVFAAS